MFKFHSMDGPKEWDSLLRSLFPDHYSLDTFKENGKHSLGLCSFLDLSLSLLTIKK